ncbi:PQQ-binding-like beta-propeller repeat protein, partial [Candidatus Poribacteria bacterium]|nr:PQQ-binding-like beta-propeller repeat protein [Candidatus Poribacteria bacterium]
LVVLFVIAGFAGADEWHQWRGENREGVWMETGIIEAFEGSEIPIRWRVPISSGYSGPTVADGRVYVTDKLMKPKQVERVHCFDWETGEKLWSYTYDCVYKIDYAAGPRATVTVHGGLAYALGAMGHLHCFDATTGEVIWKKDLNTEYNIEMPIWGIASAPLVEGEHLIVQIGGTPEACIVAFDRKTGKEKWRAVDDTASYSAPIIITHAGQRVLISWTGNNIAALDPETGTVHWLYSFPSTRWEIGIATPIFYENELFFTNFYEGSLLLKLAPDSLDVELAWHRTGKDERNTEAIQTTMSTPVRVGHYIYGVDSYGEFRCIDARNGDRIWEDLSAVPTARWSTIHSVKHPAASENRVWMFNERGELLITDLTPEGLNIVSRAKLIEPTRDQLNRRGGVTWAHPAYAYKHVFARNDEELICANLAKTKK